MIWLLFADSKWRSLHNDWHQYARCSLAHFRADSANGLQTARFEELTHCLLQISEEFRKWWELREVLTPQPHRKVFQHPVRGKLCFDLTVLQAQEASSLRVFVFSPADSVNGLTP